jgi:hypothetical protein
MNIVHNKTSVLRLCVEMCVLHCGRVGGAESKVVSMRDEGVWGSVTPLILYIGIECRWVTSFTPRSLYVREAARYELSIGCGGGGAVPEVAKRF